MLKLKIFALALSVLITLICADIIGLALFHFFVNSSESTEKNTCLQYEQAGVIQKGSCMCVEKIYKNWQESYDWKDACDILHSRDTTATK